MNNPVDQPKVSELDAKALEAAFDAPFAGVTVGQWLVTTWDLHEDREGRLKHSRRCLNAAIRAYLAALTPQATTVGWHDSKETLARVVAILTEFGMPPEGEVDQFEWLRERLALIGIPGAEKGEAVDDSDPPMAALLRVERDGSLPDNARRAAQLAIAEITRLRSVHPAPTSERVQALEEAAKIADEFPNMGEYSGREIAARLRAIAKASK